MYTSSEATQPPIPLQGNWGPVDGERRPGPSPEAAVTDPNDEPTTRVGSALRV